ncbi:MAG: Na-Ca exchanger/integrin-beta4, partial [Pedosphaera sp.]|nr:Na-Ca exchanger/integrin-beta4 [Pedosphaera sp.]
NLDGDYSTAAGGPDYLTLGPLNFRNATSVVLQFQRWLNSDYRPFAAAEVEVSNDGTNWTTLVANAGVETKDAARTRYQYDVSSVVDNQPAAYVRWGYQTAAGAFSYSGWNIDDVEFLGMTGLQFVLPLSATEGDGNLVGQGHLRVTHAPAADVIISLQSSDSAEIAVPTSMTLLAGQTNVDFDLTIGDDVLLNGSRSVMLTASAAGYLNGSDSITLLDNETAVLTVTLPTSAVEGDAPLQSMVSASDAPINDITVSLFSSDTNSVQVPATVTLPAGQTLVGFAVTFMDDQVINGDRPVTVSAQVQNWTSGAAAIVMQDNESTNLTLTLPAQARRSNGVLKNAGHIQISGILATNLPVTLALTNPANLILPPNVIILAGQNSAAFDVTLVDGNQGYGTVPVVVSASATGFGGDHRVITLVDDQTPPAPFNPFPPHLSTNNPTTVQLSWSLGLGEGTEQLVHGNFESGALSNWILLPTNGGFVIDDGMVAPASGGPLLSPFAGSYSALCSQSPPGASLMSQDLVLPADAGTIIFNWVDQISNYAVAFATNQQFKVELRDTNDVTLAVLFTTQPGDPLAGDWTQREVDLSAYRGQRIRVTFMVAADLDFLDVRLDEISIRTAHLPPVTYDVYFGTNSTPGQAQLLGSTTNASWSLPVLTPLTPYYWQVVARRANQTPGPVWQFSSVATMSITNVTVVEGNSGTTNALFNVHLTGGNSQVVSMDFATVDGSAVAPDNYAATNGTLIFNPGETNKTIAVPINGDTLNEPDKAFFLTFSNPVNARVLTNRAICTILNDDNSPPSLAPIPNQTVVALTPLIITNSAVDPDVPNETLAFTLDPGAPAGASIDPASGLFTWTPTEAQAPASYTITVRVTDNGSPPLSDARTFTVAVVSRPKISSISLAGSGNIVLGWSAIAGQSYRVEYTTDLNAGWNSLPGDVLANGSTATKLDPATLGQQRFYRILVLP